MSDETLNTLLNVIIIGGMAVLIFNYIYGSDTGEDEIYNVTYNNSSVVQTYVPKMIKPSNISSDPINISLATEDDKQLIVLIIEGDNILRGDIVKASDAAKKEDYKSFETSGIIIKKDSQKYLDKINGINISSSFNNLSEEYRQALENFYKAGRYIEIGSRNPLSKDIEKSIGYINDAKANMDNAYYIMKLNRSESNIFISNMNMSNTSMLNKTDMVK